MTYILMFHPGHFAKKNDARSLLLDMRVHNQNAGWQISKIWALTSYSRIS